MMDGNWDGSWGVVGWLLMSLMMILVWGVPVALVVWLVRSSFRPGQPAGTTSPESRAEQVLAERYARGEINEEEFAHRSEVLRTDPKALS